MSYRYFIRRSTNIILCKKKLIDIAETVCPQVHIQPIASPPPSIQMLFPWKDPLSKDLTSHVVLQHKMRTISNILSRYDAPPTRRTVS